MSTASDRNHWNTTDPSPNAELERLRRRLEHRRTAGLFGPPGKASTPAGARAALPLTLIGAGAAWLGYEWMRGSRTSSRSSGDHASESSKRVSMAGETNDSAGRRGGSNAVWDARQEAAHRAREVSEEHPLGTGAAALAAGLLTGLLLPSSPLEDRWLGPVRQRITDDLEERARERGRELLAQADDAIDAATRAARRRIVERDD